MNFNAALVYADKNSRFAVETRQALQELKILDVIYCSDFNAARKILADKKIRLILLNDTHSHPLEISLRMFLSEIVGVLSPVVTLTSMPIGKKYIQSMGRPMVLNEPLSKVKLKSAIETLSAVWFNDKYKCILETLAYMKDGQQDLAVDLIKAKISDPQLQSILVPAFAQFLCQRQEFTVAEKILLFALKKSPDDFGLILATSQFYISASLPSMAMRIIDNIESKQGNKSVFVLDKLQCYILLQDFDACEKLLKEHAKLIIMDHRLKDYLVRVQYALGRDLEMESSIADSPLADLWYDRLNGHKAQAS